MKFLTKVVTSSISEERNPTESNSDISQPTQKQSKPKDPKRKPRQTT